MENLGIDIKLMAAQLINFALFFYIFKRFIAKPFRNFIDSERKSEEEREAGVATLVKSEEEFQQRQVKLKSQLKKDADKLIEEAKLTAEKLKEDIIETANTEALSIREKAKKQLEADRESIVTEARERIVSLSFILIEKTLKDILTEDVRKKTTERMLKNLPKKLDIYEN